MKPFEPPVAQLLKLGGPKPGEYQVPEVDYLALGLTEADIPELIRLATDVQFAENERQVSWGPLHALKALGAMKAEEAVEPLYRALPAYLIAEFDQWTFAFEKALGQIGPAAVEPSARVLADRAHHSYTRERAGSALAEIGKNHPETRDRCVELVAGALSTDPNDSIPAFNGLLVANLMDLKAVEAAPAMEAAFRAELVDETIAGDWEEVAFELGIGPKPSPNREPKWVLAPRNSTPAPAPPRKDVKKELRKQKNQARRRNRGR
jgi:hypothetical protein